MRLDKNNILTGSVFFKEQNNLVKIAMDIDNPCIYMANIYMDGKKIFTKQLTKSSTQIYSVIIPYLKEFLEDEVDISISVTSQFNQEVSESNRVNLFIDKEAILLTLSDAKDEMLTNLTAEIALIKKDFQDAINCNFVNTIPGIDHSTIKKGMVPMAIQDGGPLVYSHQFLDSISSVNGKHGIGKEVILKAEDIQADSGLSIQECLEGIYTMANSNTENTNNLLGVINNINNRIADIENDILLLKS